MSNNKIKLSIIVPVYKVELYIERFLDSLLLQSNKEQYEVVFVDDCGDDNSIPLVEKILQKTEINFKIVRHNKNLGVSAARNSGLNNAIGEYIYWADSDDILEENAVNYLFKAINEYPHQKIFYFNARHKNIGDEELREWPTCNSLKKEMFAQDYLKLLYQGEVGAYLWRYLFHKDLFYNVRFQVGSVWEDAIIFPSILNTQDKIVCFKDLFIYQYILKSASITQSVHPQISNVIPSLNNLESKLYPTKNENLYQDFVFYRTSITMTLSRECFMRTKRFSQLMAIHKKWSSEIPKQNITVLWNNGKKRSAVFLEIIKIYPALLYLLYRIKILK